MIRAPQRMFGLLTLLAVARESLAGLAAPLANCSAGAFVGYGMLSSDGRRFWGFSGIRYAQPPVGDLRFKDPLPIEPFDGVQKAFDEGSSCLQIDPLVKPEVITGSEDCLFLNIYTHDVNRQAPVMLWIHGGAWKFGTGSKRFYGPDFLMNEDIVLVAINYRLGPIGFASLENDVMPGNMGLKDQEEAIRWVKKNIAGFGGDPEKITLFGQSAGGASVTFHLKGRMAGLVRGGIAQSGSSLSPWAVGRAQSVRKITLELADIAGCGTRLPDDSIYQCLLDLPGERIMKAVQGLPIFDQEKLPFRPVIEAGGPVPMDPWDAPPSDLPLMSGHTSTEGAFYTAILLKGGGEFVLTLINKAFNRVAPDILMFEATAPDPIGVAEKIRSFYFGNRNITRQEVKSLEEVTTDSWFVYPIRTEIERHNGTAYSYVFDYTGSRTIFEVFNISTELRLGPGHGDDLPYLFRAEALDLLADGTYEDLLKSREIVKIWTKFAKGEDPTPVPVEGNNWEEKSEDGGYLVISHETSKIVDSTRDDSWQKRRLDFWKGLTLRTPLSERTHEES
uniref:Carboxylic ester hydrolase n=3 Tax=Lygus hesperus TaxID=30085 RepID=A0A146LZ20_LYGHE